MGDIFSPVASVIESLNQGNAVILLDDEDRENEGDLVVASEAITAKHISFMLNHSRGLICVSLQKEAAERLALAPQAAINTSPYTTAFLTPVDAAKVAQNGGTAPSRAQTIRQLANSSSLAKDFVRPGNIFPLLAHDAGVFGRRGQTEGSADLARLAGFAASGVICELLSDTGEVLRGKTLEAYVRRHGLACTSVESLKQYRAEHDISVRLVSKHSVTNTYGSWEALVYRDDAEKKEHVALVYQGTGSPVVTPLVRVHSECITGDFLGSLRCDCGSQLHHGLAAIAAAGTGALIYLRQEGRGIGLIKKLEAYNLQDAGLDTVDANLSLGFEIDARRYTVAARILQNLEMNSVRLVTNNPLKIEALKKHGIFVTERIPSVSVTTPHNRHYLETKKLRMGHIV